jgi:hypothetical protein
MFDINQGGDYLKIFSSNTGCSAPIPVYNQTQRMFLTGMLQSGSFGRRKVLKHFLEMESIFKTKYFQDKYEDQARMNISAELKSLS